MLALVAATTLIAIAGLFELWHAYDQAVLPATTGQAARYNGIGQNPNQIPMLIALRCRSRSGSCASRAAARALWRSAVVLLLAGSLARLRFARRTGRGVRRLPCLPARDRAATASGCSPARPRSSFVAILATQLPQPATKNPVLYGTFGRTPKLGPKT